MLPIHELDALIRRYQNQGSLDGPLNQLEETLLVQISELADGGVKGLYIYDDLEKTFITADDGFLKAVQEQLEERAE